MSEKPKPEKPQFDIIEKVLTMMLVILAASILVPQFIAAYHHEDVALAAMILEKEIDSQFWMILSALVAALGVTKMSNKP